MTEEQLYCNIEFKSLAFVCGDFNHVANNGLMVMKWGRTSCMFPFVDHYWRRHRHGVKRKRQRKSPYRRVQIAGLLASQCSSAISQQIKQTMNLSISAKEPVCVRCTVKFWRGLSLSLQMQAYLRTELCQVETRKGEYSSFRWRRVQDNKVDQCIAG